jgi:protease II
MVWIVDTGSDEAFAMTLREEYAMQLKSRIRDVRVNLSNRRTERVARRQLAAELASFVTPAERAELDLMLGRHTPEETREIRDILSQQEYERQRKATVVGGYRV